MKSDWAKSILFDSPLGKNSISNLETNVHKATALHFRYINFLSEMVANDKNPVENQVAAQKEEKKIIVHSPRGKNKLQTGLIDSWIVDTKTASKHAFSFWHLSAKSVHCSRHMRIDN